MAFQKYNVRYVISLNVKGLLNIRFHSRRQEKHNFCNICSIRAILFVGRVDFLRVAGSSLSADG